MLFNIALVAIRTYSLSPSVFALVAKEKASRLVTSLLYEQSRSSLVTTAQQTIQVGIISPFALAAMAYDPNFYGYLMGQDMSDFNQELFAEKSPFKAPLTGTSDSLYDPGLDEAHTSELGSFIASGISSYTRPNYSNAFGSNPQSNFTNASSNSRAPVGGQESAVSTQNPTSSNLLDRPNASSVDWKGKAPMRNIEPSSVDAEEQWTQQPFHAQPPGDNVVSPRSTNVKQSAQPSAQHQARANPPAANLMPPPSTHVGQSAQPSAQHQSHAESSTANSAPITEDPPLIVLLATMVSSIRDLDTRVAEGTKALSECETYSREIKVTLGKILQELSCPFIGGDLTSSELSGAVPGVYHSTTMPDAGPSKYDMTSSIDLSRDPRPGAKARLAAQNSAKNARSPNHKKQTNDDLSRESASATPRKSTQPRPRNLTTWDDIRRKEARKRSTVAPDLHYRSLAGTSGEDGTFNPSDPNHPDYRGRSRSSSRRPTSQTTTNDQAQRRKRPSSSSQAVAVDDSEPEASTAVISRSTGPSDIIEGMLPGAGADRLLMMQRASLPKGNINGLPYSCEMQCGYPDKASVSMVRCDSAFHRKQPYLKLAGGKQGERGWYHRPCTKRPADADPDTWICDPSLRTGTTSTDDQDHDEGGDDDQDDKPGSGGDDDSDDYQPAQDTPEESSHDEDGANEAKDDSDYNDKKRRRDKGSNSEKTKKRYILDTDDEDQDDSRPGNVDQPNEGGRRQRQIRDTYNDNGTTLVPRKTKPGTLWIEEEKALAIELMKQIVADGKIFGEARFAEIARLMRSMGYPREWTSVKNVWNRGLRERSGIDERKNKKAPLTTSKQDSETKKKNKEVRQQRLGPNTTRNRTRSVRPKTDRPSPKREYVSDEEEEVMPRKRRRPSPYDGDRFDGLP